MILVVSCLTVSYTSKGQKSKVIGRQRESREKNLHAVSSIYPSQVSYNKLVVVSWVDNSR